MTKAGTGLDIMLGKHIRAIAPTAPLLDSGHNLYGYVESGASMTYQGVELKLDQELSLAFDLSNPAVFRKIQSTAIIQKVALGFSSRCQLRYTPAKEPDGMTAPQLLGHIFTGAELSLDKLGLSFAVGATCSSIWMHMTMATCERYLFTFHYFQRDRLTTANRRTACQCSF